CFSLRLRARERAGIPQHKRRLRAWPVPGLQDSRPAKVIMLADPRAWRRRNGRGSQASRRFRLVARHAHRLRGRTQQPAAGLLHPPAALVEKVVELRRDHKSTVRVARQITESGMELLWVDWRGC